MLRKRPPKTILIITQVYLPDPAAVGMLFADAARALAERGYRVRVLTADRGYDDPSARYPRRETLNGVEVLRLPFSSFGKNSIAKRLASGSLFVAQSSLLSTFIKDVDAVLVSTSPPMVGLAALWVGTLRRVPLAYWVMDLNPDQMVVLGKLSEESPFVKAFDFLNRAILSRAELVVALDEFMAERLNAKLDVSDKLEISPPWPHDDHLETVDHADNPFRKQHGLSNKFVVMYSGNHGPSSPVTTCLEAAKRLESREDIVFLFVGGGIGKAAVEQRIAEGAPNVLSLPYQPLDSIKYSLSAADVHMVTVGDAIVGVVHPCKVYGAMSIGRPIFLTAPERCHATPLVTARNAGVRVDNGDYEGAARAIVGLADMPREELRAMGRRGQAHIAEHYSQAKLVEQFVDLVVTRLRLN